MAKVVEFDRFKVIKASAKEMFEAVGSPGVCDFCSERPATGYYIAVLNKWYCPKCWEEFKKRAKWYPEDAIVENQNFIYYCLALGIELDLSNESFAAIHD